jgi:aminoglycoside phosphotransferase (APT) family kinase protein
MFTYEPTAVLWYEHATMADLMADLQIMLEGLPPRATLRVRTSLPEAWDAIPAWCEARGYHTVHMSDTYEGTREGAQL